MKNPIVVVTGGGRGIGRATALAFAAEGATLYLIARTKGELGESARLAAKAGGEARSLPADLSVPAEVERAASRILQESGRVDVLVNNAGTLKVAPFAETTLEQWEGTLRVNLTAPFLLTKALLPQIRKSAMPHIFNILSIAARVPFAGSAAYCASKAGLLGLNGVLREELRPLGIRVTAVLPGATDTKMFDEIPGEYDRSRFVRPEDIAASIVSAWRLSPEANVDEIQIRTLKGIT